MKKFALLALSLLSIITLSACADLPLIGPLFVESFENQIELLEENGWNDILLDSGITILNAEDLEDDICSDDDVYCASDLQNLVLIWKGSFLSDFSVATIIEYNSVSLARESFDQALESSDYEGDDIYRKGRILYIISTGDYSEEFVDLLDLNP